MIYIGGTFVFSLFRAPGDVPAGGVIKQFFYALYTDLLVMDKVPQTSDPFYIVFGVVSVLISESICHTGIVACESRSLAITYL